MSINELVVFIGLVCNLDQPSSVVSRTTKEMCGEFYVNCMVGPNGEISSRKVSACLEKAKIESKKWR